VERVETVLELRDGALRAFTGPWSACVAALDAEQEAARRAVRAAEGDVRRERREQAAAEIVLARRQRYAAHHHATKRRPKIVMNTRRQEAQESAGRYRTLHADRLATARAALETAEAVVRDDDRIRVDLPATAVPAGTVVAEVDGLVVRGPERIALTGANGSGKTTLLRRLAAAPPAVPFGYLPQRPEIPDPDASVLDSVRAGPSRRRRAPGSPASC
jgi:ATPase subunit of ABC transporter with duplicated ATPase domains